MGNHLSCSISGGGSVKSVGGKDLIYLIQVRKDTD